jgi:hypothetical protein
VTWSIVGPSESWEEVGLVFLLGLTGLLCMSVEGQPRWCALALEDRAWRFTLDAESKALYFTLAAESMTALDCLGRSWFFDLATEGKLY